MTRLRREMYNNKDRRNPKVDNDTDKYLTTYCNFYDEVEEFALADWNTYKQEQAL